MDFPTARAIFFAPPAEGAPTPVPFTGTPSPARRLRDAIEPLACVSIWSEEAAERYVELGLDDWFAAYVWQRRLPRSGRRRPRWPSPAWVSGPQA